MTPKTAPYFAFPTGDNALPEAETTAQPSFGQQYKRTLCRAIISNLKPTGFYLLTIIVLHLK